MKTENRKSGKLEKLQRKKKKHQRRPFICGDAYDDESSMLGSGAGVG